MRLISTSAGWCCRRPLEDSRTFSQCENPSWWHNVLRGHTGGIKQEVHGYNQEVYRYAVGVCCKTHRGDLSILLLPGVYPLGLQLLQHFMQGTKLNTHRQVFITLRTVQTFVSRSNVGVLMDFISCHPGNCKALLWPSTRDIESPATPNFSSRWRTLLFCPQWASGSILRYSYRFLNNLMTSGHPMYQTKTMEPDRRRSSKTQLMIYLFKIHIHSITA